MLNGKTGELVTFKCRAWLDATSEDGLIEREFYPMTECSYKLELQVSPVLCFAVPCRAVLCCSVLCCASGAISVTDLLKPAPVHQVPVLCCAELGLGLELQAQLERCWLFLDAEKPLLMACCMPAR